MAKPVLSIEGLTVRLPLGADRENAVEDISFTVAPGESLGVIGPNGSGSASRSRRFCRSTPGATRASAAGACST